MIKTNCKTKEPTCPCPEELHPEIVYMMIPAEWACLYQKLLVAVADFGEQMLMDCKASCKDSNKNIINCWHMFVSAIAAWQLGKKKLAETLIKYIKAQLSLIYRNMRCAEFDTMIPLPISEDGQLKALLGCDDGIRFFVDMNTGELCENHIKEKCAGGTFDIEDNDLKYNS